MLIHFLKPLAIFLFLLACSSCFLQAQDITFLNGQLSRITDENEARFKMETKKPDNNCTELFLSIKENENWGKEKLISIMEPDSENKFRIYNDVKRKQDYVIREITDTTNIGFRIKDTNTDGKIIQEAEVLKFFPLILHGSALMYDLDELVMAKLTYVNNRKLNEIFQFNPVDSIGKEEINVPVFPGGDRGFLKEVAMNLRYPVSAIKNGISDEVYVKFIINKEGKMVDATVVNETNNVLKKEGLRVISSIKKRWQPAEYNGAKIAVWYYAKITFNVGPVFGKYKSP